MEFSWSEILLELLAVAVLFFGVHWSLRHAKTLDQASMLPFADDEEVARRSSGKPAGAAPAAAVPVAARTTAGTGTRIGRHDAGQSLQGFIFFSSLSSSSNCASFSSPNRSWMRW